MLLVVLFLLFTFLLVSLLYFFTFNFLLVGH